MPICKQNQPTSFTYVCHGDIKRSNRGQERSNVIITLSTCITTEFIFQQGLESKSRKAVCPCPSICDTCMHIPMYIIMQVSVLITAACIFNDRYAFAYCSEGLTFQCLPFLCVFRPSALRVFLTIFLIHSLITGIVRNNNICFLPY